MIETFPKIIGAVGSKATTVGPAYYGAAIKALGLNYSYFGFGTDNLIEFFSTAKSLDMRGFALAMPYKEQIIPLLSELTPDVEAIGACNCALNEGGKWVGHNTDWSGAMQALTEAGIKHSGRALVVGAGGAGRAIAYGLKKNGWDVAITNRNKARADRVQQSLALEQSIAWQDASNYKPDLLVNATPAMIPSEFIDISVLKNSASFFNVVFNPKTTELDAIAAKEGATVVHGWRMLLFQASHIFKLYTGHDAPLDVMSAALSEKLS